MLGVSDEIVRGGNTKAAGITKKIDRLQSVRQIANVTRCTLSKTFVAMRIKPHAFVSAADIATEGILSKVSKK
jgi:hypothetical protein